MNYQGIYDQIVDRAKQRKLEGYKEKHHIVPRCMGGSNDKENLAELTAREHFIVHRLLCEIYPHNRMLIFAFWGMCNQVGSLNNVRNYRVSSKTYQVGREAFIQAVTGRACTWGDKISNSKKGVRQGRRSAESVARQKDTVSRNHYKHSDQVRQKISAQAIGVCKSDEHRKAIAKSHKLRGTKPPSQAKRVEIGGRIFSSIKEACEVLEIPRHVARKQVNFI